ncbi:N-(5'-phosphoribosyl)anthranilate isomerase [Neotabrizicola sp. VNH66]|uniref:N-(5'-phosphoribosyl)anthranilate isomerase n=1 Tax=Neotabrizicola sp. VNH66 TaxID=3400918 RepID=UPI003BFBAA8E
MTIIHDPAQAALWFSQLTASPAMTEGGVLHRSVSEIDSNFGREAFLEEMQRRGFSVVENAGQVVIFCNRAPLRRLL